MLERTKRKEAVQAQGCRCRRSEMSRQTTLPRPWPNPSSQIGLRLDLAPMIQHAAMLVEDSLGRTASTSPPHRRRALSPCDPNVIPPSPEEPSGPQLADPAAVFHAEGAVTAAGEGSGGVQGGQEVRRRLGFEAGDCLQSAREGVTPNTSGEARTHYTTLLEFVSLSMHNLILEGKKTEC